MGFLRKSIRDYGQKYPFPEMHSSWDVKGGWESYITPLNLQNQSLSMFPRWDMILPFSYLCICVVYFDPEEYSQEYK